MRVAIAAFVTLLLTGCQSISTETITGSIVGHAQFPSLSLAVSDCLAERPDVRREVTPAWNRLVDKWEAADDLPRDARLVTALANAPRQVAEAERDWTFIRDAVVDSGLDCGPEVKAMVTNIQDRFKEIKSAVYGNDRAIYVLQWASLLSSVLRGDGNEINRLPS